MYDVPSNPSLDNMLSTGIYALSASVEYTTTYSGLPNKTGWLYLLVYCSWKCEKTNKYTILTELHIDGKTLKLIGYSYILKAEAVALLVFPVLIR